MLGQKERERDFKGKGKKALPTNSLSSTPGIGEPDLGALESDTQDLDKTRYSHSSVREGRIGLAGYFRLAVVLYLPPKTNILNFPYILRMEVLSINMQVEN